MLTRDLTAGDHRAPVFLCQFAAQLSGAREFDDCRFLGGERCQRPVPFHVKQTPCLVRGAPGMLGVTNTCSQATKEAQLVQHTAVCVSVCHSVGIGLSMAHFLRLCLSGRIYSPRTCWWLHECATAVSKCKKLPAAGVGNSKGDVKAKIKSNTNLYTVADCSTGKQTKLLEFCMAGKTFSALIHPEPMVEPRTFSALIHPELTEEPRTLSAQIHLALPLEPRAFSTYINPELPVEPRAFSTYINPELSVEPITFSVLIHPELPVEPRTFSALIHPELHEEPRTLSALIHPGLTVEPRTFSALIHPELTVEPRTFSALIHPELTVEPRTLSALIHPELTVEPRTFSALIHPELPVEPRTFSALIHPELPVEPRTLSALIHPGLTVEPRTFSALIHPELPVEPKTFSALIHPELPVEPKTFSALIHPDLPVEPKTFSALFHPELPVEPRPFSALNHPELPKELPKENRICSNSPRASFITKKFSTHIHPALPKYSTSPRSPRHTSRSSSLCHRTECMQSLPNCPTTRCYKAPGGTSRTLVISSSVKAPGGTSRTLVISSPGKAPGRTSCTLVISSSGKAPGGTSHTLVISSPGKAPELPVNNSLPGPQPPNRPAKPEKEQNSVQAHCVLQKSSALGGLTVKMACTRDPIMYNRKLGFCLCRWHQSVCSRQCGSPKPLSPHMQLPLCLCVTPKRHGKSHKVDRFMAALLLQYRGSQLLVAEESQGGNPTKGEIIPPNIENRDFPVQTRDCGLRCQKRDCPSKNGTVGRYMRRLISAEGFGYKSFDRSLKSFELNDSNNFKRWIEGVLFDQKNLRKVLGKVPLG
ncbi:hypothetical protein XELAEV_18038040mg [Xenopus laevis]|uniref:Uncharacterized protein n=1 Tax=Xenopus laevis TaxID=8355 RepID=A0A974HB67_XENLA|nr:hypothetical protein XELAEV_18038040mg [Xenopus laevis]